MTTKTLDAYQREIMEWRDRQPFRGEPAYRLLLGVVEEVGELAHAHLKEESGIRGTPDEMQAKARDACGDILVFLLSYCSARGWSADEVLRETWDEVKLRDWEKNRKTGR
jgi:NTP pyrophosphatase (non-canonical NTP hydrolase)